MTRLAPFFWRELKILAPDLRRLTARDVDAYMQDWVRNSADR